MTTLLSIDLANTIVDATAKQHENGVMVVYEGPIPENADAAIPDECRELCLFEFSETPFTRTETGTIVSERLTCQVLRSGRPTFARSYRKDGVCLSDFLVPGDVEFRDEDNQPVEALVAGMTSTLQFTMSLQGPFLDPIPGISEYDIEAYMAKVRQETADEDDL